MDAASGRSADDPEDVAFLHDEQVFAVDLHLGARPLAKQDAVADVDVEGGARTGLLVADAGADGEDLLIMKESDILGIIA